MGIENFMWTSGVTLLAMLMYFWTTMRVGQARGKYGVKAPAVTGAPEFERAFRAQQNTVEQLVFFLPSLWLFAALYKDMWAGIAGAVWVVGRVVYVLGYAQAADKRAAGFMIALVANMVLLIGAFVCWFM